jgi:hypothetical protein
MASRTADEIGPITALMRFLFKNILMHICITLGVFGNILTLIVLLQKQMKRTSQAQYLAALTLFDLIYIICSFINNIEIIYPSLKNSFINPFLNLIFYPLGDFSSNSSVYVILMFSIERYIAIAYPLFSLQWCRPSRARKIIMCTIIFTFALTFPTFLENKITFKYDSAFNSTRPQLVQTGVYSNFDLYKSIYYWIIAVMIQFIPLTLLIIFNGILMKFIHESSKNDKNKKIKIEESRQSQSNIMTNANNKTSNQDRVSFSSTNVENSQADLKKSASINACNTNTSNNSNVEANGNNGLKAKKNTLLNTNNNYELRSHRSQSSSNQSDQKATILLIATVLVFLICQLPSALLLIYDAIFPLENQTNKVVIDVVLGLNNIANGLTAINASVNFILYSCFSKKFRETFKSFFSSSASSKYNYNKKYTCASIQSDVNNQFNRKSEGIKVYKFKQVNDSRS